MTETGTNPELATAIERLEDSLSMADETYADCVRKADIRTVLAALSTTPETGEPVSTKKTMTLNLTDEEMVALEALAAKKDLSPPNVFRQALKLYQLEDAGLSPMPMRADTPLPTTSSTVEGWKLVPVEPTNEMLEALAGYGIQDQDEASGWVEGYAAMRAASPAVQRQDETILWCCHARGPDDLLAAPDYETAVQWSITLNKVGDLVAAYPAIWPGSAGSHASSLPDAVASMTAPPLREPDNDPRVP